MYIYIYAYIYIYINPNSYGGSAASTRSCSRSTTRCATPFRSPRPSDRCLANMARIRQSRPSSGRGFQTNSLKRCLPSLGSAGGTLIYVYTYVCYHSYTYTRTYGSAGSMRSCSRSTIRCATVSRSPPTPISNREFHFQTLNSELQTLHPTPYTLNTTPQILNHKPQTLSPISKP